MDLLDLVGAASRSNTELVPHLDMIREHLMRSSPVVTRFHLISPDLIWFHLISSHTTPAAGHFLCLISHVLARSPDFIFWWHLISSLLTWCHLLWCHHNYLQQLVTCLHNVQLRSIIFTFCNYSLFCQIILNEVLPSDSWLAMLGVISSVSVSPGVLHLV